MVTDAFECFLSSEDKTNIKLVFCPHGAKSSIRVTNRCSLRCLLIRTLSATFMVFVPFLSLIIIVTTVFSLGSLLNPFGINQRKFKGSK